MAEQVSHITWVLEDEVFPDSHVRLRQAVVAAGGEIVAWKDEWWTGSRWPRLQGKSVVFHGSLGNAARIRTEVGWRPGAFCDVAAFRCSTWYSRASKWLLNTRWKILAAQDFVRQSAMVLDELNCSGDVFVRPDSPMKPFSGRVLPRNGISMAALDFGFYFDDPSPPVVVAPVTKVGREWRCVVAGDDVVAVSSYAATTRRAIGSLVDPEVKLFAMKIAHELPPPEPVYVLDVCEGPDGLRLLELNPFSGADLYDCPADAIVDAIGKSVLGLQDAG